MYINININISPHNRANHRITHYAKQTVSFTSQADWERLGEMSQKGSVAKLQMRHVDDMLPLPLLRSTILSLTQPQTHE